MPCPKIIALDMDGTLLDEHGRIPDAFWAVSYTHLTLPTTPYV